MTNTITAMPPFPWQHTFWQNFCDVRAKDRLPHALLLCGIDGVGIELLAHSMARYLLCQSPLEDVACGRCRGCELYDAGTHPDLKVLGLEDDAKKIKVDQVRSIVDFVGKTPHFSGYKVVVVEQADLMNSNSANAILKSLEEPAGQTIFILATTRTSAILPTIRSRCQKSSVSTPGTEAGLAWLREQNVDDAENWLQEAGGAPVLAKTWAEGDYAVQRQSIVGSMAGFFDSAESVLTVASVWQKIPMDMLVSIQLAVLDAMIRAQSINTLQDQQLSRCYEVFGRLNPTLLFKMRDKLLAKLAATHSGSNLNPLMLCEELAMDWHALATMAQRVSRSKAVQ